MGLVRSHPSCAPEESVRPPKMDSFSLCAGLHPCVNVLHTFQTVASKNINWLDDEEEEEEEEEVEEEEEEDGGGGFEVLLRWSSVEPNPRPDATQPPTGLGL
ncbi:unnamed protein product [Pleuronectes platessa]|uniref:Uncharacterized protein n=1 Tax=Pleuronectes platessa TaxID=8262 RepID=A0A9N7UY50_PLEPL|nr:unnamed protein product [Pleuronectes platessa]